MRTSFGQMFWGLLLVLLGININGFDLLLDGIGYLVIAAGCQRASGQDPRFETARNVSVLLAVLWLIGFAVPPDGAWLFNPVINFFGCLMIWNLLGGIGFLAHDLGRPDLAQRAHSRRVWYCGLVIAMTIAVFIAVANRDLAALALLIIIPLLILTIMILHLIHQAKVELGTEIDLRRGL